MQLTDKTRGRSKTDFGNTSRNRSKVVPEIPARKHRPAKTNNPAREKGPDSYSHLKVNNKK